MIGQAEISAIFPGDQSALAGPFGFGPESFSRTVRVIFSTNQLRR
jgi:hypothetical protein